VRDAEYPHREHRLVVDPGFDVEDDVARAAAFVRVLERDNPDDARKGVVGRSGFSNRTLSRPRPPRSASPSKRASVSRRLVSAATCQPLATRPPNIKSAAA
jgi:hypothetical protein